MCESNKSQTERNCDWEQPVLDLQNQCYVKASAGLNLGLSAKKLNKHPSAQGMTDSTVLITLEGVQDKSIGKHLDLKPYLLKVSHYVNAICL